MKLYVHILTYPSSTNFAALAVSEITITKTMACTRRNIRYIHNEAVHYHPSRNQPTDPKFWLTLARLYNFMFFSR